MLKYNSEQSFIATVQSQVTDHEGFWDCGELVMMPSTDNPGGPDVLHRKSVDWLTLSDYDGREPHRFWFRCFEDTRQGIRGYDIQSWSRREGVDFNNSGRRLQLSHNGYVGLYEASSPLETLWYPAVVEDGELKDIEARLGPIESVEIATHRGTVLTGYSRHQIGDHWYCYVAEGGHPVLQFTLDILVVGEPLRDDH